MKISERAAEARIRRAAKRLELQVVKSRWRLGSIDNHGGFRIINPYGNALVAGERFELDVSAVAGWLADYAANSKLPALAESMRELVKAKIEDKAA